MKKYLQVSVVLGILGALIFIKQNNGLNSLSSAASNGASSGNTSPNQSTTSSMLNYKNGTYTGSVQDAYYGNVQVQLTIAGNKISDITFLQYPNDNHTSIRINSEAMPLLIQETIQAQSANISGVTRASATSPAFIASLSDALNQAK